MSRVLNAGDNGGITEGVFFEHVRALEDIQKRKMKLMADEKAAKKRAKEDGVDMDDLKAVQRERAMSLAEQIASHNRKTMYQRFFKMPIGEHVNVVDENVSDETGLTAEERETKWVGVGQVAGLEGKSLTEVLSGHDPNADTGRWITAGWEKGQAQLGSKIRQKKPDPAPEKKADEKPAEAAQPETAKATEQATTEAEPAKRRGRPAKSGVTYWHNPDLKKVYEVSSADASPKEAISITKPEYEKLSAEYAKAAEDDWDQASPSPDDAPPAPAADGEEDDWNTPPAPSV